MRPLVPAALALSLILSLGRHSMAEDTPRAVLQKAVDAMGGESIGPVATHYVLRGKLPFGGKDDFTFTGEVFTQPNGDFKYTFEVGMGTTIGVTMSLVGAKGWRSVGGKLEDLDEANLAEMKLGRYYDRVTSLAPVLKDDSFKLESLPEIKVHDNPAVGIKVSSRGQPDISLFFDKTTSLLVKTEYRATPPGQDKEMLHETYYSDWREPDNTAADEQTLKAVRVQTDGPALADYLRKHMPAGGDVARIKKLVEQLGDDSFETRSKASEALIAAKIERNDLVIALGGGVVGDLAGFAAAILRRGVDFVQVPTSLLAQVDSSVGGKTGINSPQGKNLVGAFHQPVLVIADTSVLDTLPPRQFRAGYAEVAKYGVLGDEAFFAWLEANHAEIFKGGAARERAIATSCRAKAAIVARDERETGDRALLNLGHTFGHALEAATGF